MSSPPPPSPAEVLAAAASRDPSRKRFRHFWEGPEDEESDEEKQGAEHVSPVARLYRHALESVFGFLGIDDLSRVLSVSGSWSSAVRSMKPIGAKLVQPRSFSLVAASPLAHHVRQLGSDWWSFELTSNDMFLLSHHLGSLTALACSVRLPQPSRLFFGASLTSLSLGLKGKAKKVSAINDAIVTISQLPQLTDLMLELPSFFPALCFAPLTAASKLRDLQLNIADWPRPTSEHLDQLRLLPQLRMMAIGALSSANIVYLLRAPHSLQWQHLYWDDDFDEDLAVALSTLPTLTQLHTRNCTSVSFLPALTRLRGLWLKMDPDDARLAAAIVAGLSCCSQLTELTLLEAEDVTSQHMGQALSHLPLLCSLTLFSCPALESLSFLSECACLTQSLQSLELSYCKNAALHSTELKHVLTLKNLTSLAISRSFVEPLDACAQALLTPPSVVLPKLKEFDYHTPLWQDD